MKASSIIGNFLDTPEAYFVELHKSYNETGNPVFEEAEVKIKMDEVLYNAWEAGGKVAQELSDTDEETKKKVEGNDVIIDNLYFANMEAGVLDLFFNFLTEKVTAKDRFYYDLVQRSLTTGEIIGGTTFVIMKSPRPLFHANADDKEVDKGELVTLTAETINEAAVYNWYDMEGNLIYQGEELTVTADMAKKFKLEVIATADGFKDYKEVEIKLKPNRITLLSPNPADNNLHVEYKVNEGTSAYLTITNISGNSSAVGNYVLDINSDYININLSSYPTGVYSVSLIVDGQVADVQELIKG